MKQKNLLKIIGAGIVGTSLSLGIPQYSDAEPIKNRVSEVEQKTEDKPFPVGLIFLGYGIGAGIAGALGYYSNINFGRQE